MSRVLPVTFLAFHRSQFYLGNLILMYLRPNRGDAAFAQVFDNSDICETFHQAAWYKLISLLPKMIKSSLKNYYFKDMHINFKLSDGEKQIIKGFFLPNSLNLWLWEAHK